MKLMNPPRELLSSKAQIRMQSRNDIKKTFMYFSSRNRTMRFVTAVVRSFRRTNRRLNVNGITSSMNPAKWFLLTNVPVTLKSNVFFMKKIWLRPEKYSSMPYNDSSSPTAIITAAIRLIWRGERITCTITTNSMK